VVTEVKRLEDVSVKNDRELHKLAFKDFVPGFSGEDGAEIRTELDQLNNRLKITDKELQKTNLTLRQLGDDLKSFSQEQSRQEEAELKQEVDRIQAEIKHFQKSSEEGVNISDKLHQEVQDIENQISARKSEVEKLIQDMMSANLKSLTYEKQGDNKHFLDGPSKPGTTRKMLGSPRELENAVPTSKNPHGVWV
jgi:Ras association domain-containing protein 7/8